MVLGGVELSSIARGFEVLDVIVKVAPVSILNARPVCPGKFLVFFTGDVASVESSLTRGREKAESFLVDQLLIPNLHKEVTLLFEDEKVRGKTKDSKNSTGLEIDIKGVVIDAVGFIESYTAISAVRAADTACKESEVRLVRMRLAREIGGKSFFIITGNIEAVEAAVNAAIVFERDRGFLCKEVIIPRPHPDILDYLKV